MPFEFKIHIERNKDQRQKAARLTFGLFHFREMALQCRNRAFTCSQNGNPYEAKIYMSIAEEMFDGCQLVEEDKEKRKLFGQIWQGFKKPMPEEEVPKLLLPLDKQKKRKSRIIKFQPA